MIQIFEMLITVLLKIQFLCHVMSCHVDSSTYGRFEGSYFLQLRGYADIIGLLGPEGKDNKIPRNLDNCEYSRVDMA